MPCDVGMIVYELLTSKTALDTSATLPRGVPNIFQRLGNYRDPFSMGAISGRLSSLSQLFVTKVAIHVWYRQSNHLVLLPGSGSPRPLPQDRR